MAVCAMALGIRPVSADLRPARAAFPSTLPAGYYRPALVDGIAFPVARSTFFSLMEFTNDWHDPRLRFIGGRWRLVGFHEGIDITAEQGTPVISMTNGVVEQVGWTFYSGLRVGVRGTDGRYYFYAHLSSTAPDVRVGVPVSAGSVLGAVGNTGYGPPGRRDMFSAHLHFGIEGPDGWVNPYPVISSLYKRTVSLHRRGERALQRFAEVGDRDSWRRAAREMLMNPGLVQGE
ncbi:MAG TPA: M23 family metallopeptidase [Actinomycetota bacterium]|nr:M23 family metallopeptidase [Actinomycetota bacterium]